MNVPVMKSCLCAFFEFFNQSLNQIRPKLTKKIQLSFWVFWHHSSDCDQVLLNGSYCHAKSEQSCCFSQGPGELFPLTFFVMAAWNNGDHYIDLYRIPLQKYPYKLSPLPPSIYQGWTYFFQFLLIKCITKDSNDKTSHTTHKKTLIKIRKCK